MAHHVVVVLIVLGGVCVMASQVIKPSAGIRHPAVGLWTVAVVCFVTALLLRGTSAGW